jgi:hypothetical protein
VQAFPLTDVKAFMGHADIQTTMIYVHHVPQHDAADRLSRLLDERAAGASGCTPGAREPDSDEAGSQKVLICRQIVMPEEGLEPPTRGL